MYVRRYSREELNKTHRLRSSYKAHWSSIKAVIYRKTTLLITVTTLHKYTYSLMLTCGKLKMMHDMQVICNRFMIIGCLLIFLCLFNRGEIETDIGDSL